MPRYLRGALAPLLLLLSLQQFGAAALIHAKAGLAPLLVERAWKLSVAQSGRAVKPWPWADTWPVARLTVPDLEVSRFILHGDNGHALAFGPGYDTASAPLGKEGVAIIGGHRDTHFSFLQHLQQGLRVELTLPDGRSHAYRVSEVSIVDSALGVLPVLDQREQLLLITCYPFDAVSSAGTLRYVVRMVPEAPVNLVAYSLAGDSV